MGGTNCQVRRTFPKPCIHFIINHHLRTSTVLGGVGRGFSLSLYPKTGGIPRSSVGVCRRQWAESAPQWRSSWAWLWIRKEPSGACPVARWSCRPRPADSHSRWAYRDLTPTDPLSPQPHNTMTPLSAAAIQNNITTPLRNYTLARLKYLLLSQEHRRCSLRMSFAYEETWSMSNQNKKPWRVLRSMVFNDVVKK